MIEAITITNSGKPIGRWPEAAKALALVSDNEKNPFAGAPYGFWCAAQITISAWQTIGRRGLKPATPVRPEDTLRQQAKGVVLVGGLLYPLRTNNSLIALTETLCRDRP
ncbi:MAG: hypothetical protein ABWY64_23960 [Tardiphaga sp.]